MLLTYVSSVSKFIGDNVPTYIAQKVKVSSHGGSRAYYVDLGVEMEPTRRFIKKFDVHDK